MQSVEQNTPAHEGQLSATSEGDTPVSNEERLQSTPTGDKLDTDASPDEAVRKQRIAIFQCVRTSVNGVVKMLVVPISRMDQCLPVVVQQQRASGETRRAVVPAGSTITFGDDLSVLRARHVPVCTNARGLPVDMSGDAVSRALRRCQRVPRAPEASIRLCVPREETPGAGGGAGSDDHDGSTIEYTYPACDTGTDATTQLGCDALGLPSLPQHTSLMNDVNVADFDASLGSNLTWGNREGCLTDTVVTPESQDVLHYNEALSYDNALSYNHDAGSSRETTAYDGIVTTHMSNNCSMPAQYSSDVKQEANNVPEESSDETLTSIRIAHFCSLSRSWGDHSDYIEHAVCKTKIPTYAQEDFQQPNISQIVMPNIKSETADIQFYPEYEVPHKNTDDSGNIRYQSPCSQVQPMPNKNTQKTGVGNQLHLPLNNISTSEVHGSQYNSTKSEWTDQEIHSNWHVENIRHNADNFTYENNVMLTCKSSMPTNEHYQPLDDTSETSHGEAREENLELRPKRIKHELGYFDDASTLSAHHITDCTVRLVPLSDTYTQHQSVYVTKPPLRESVYSCKQLGPTTIKLVRKNNVAQHRPPVPVSDGGRLDRAMEQRRRANKARWVNGSDSSTIHTTRRRSAARAARSSRPFVYIDSPLAENILDTPSSHSRSAAEVLRTQSLQGVGQTPTTPREVSGGNCMLIFTSSSASLVPLQDAPVNSTPASSAGSHLVDSRTQLRQMLLQRSSSDSQLAESRTKLSKMLQRSNSETEFAASRTKISKTPQRSSSGSQLAENRTKLSRTVQRSSPRATVDPSTAFLRIQSRDRRGQDTVIGVSSSDSASASRRLTVNKVQCTRHLERLLRYHEKVVLEVRALLRKNAKVDVTNVRTSLGDAS